MLIKNFNDLVKGKRPSVIKNSEILSQDHTQLLEGSFLLVSNDMWTFLRSWYETDFKVKVKLAD